MGVSGSGKTTVGRLLSKQTSIPFYDGDDFHPEENVRKMSQGIPLTDRDRIAWIGRIADFMNGSPAENKILACSALNRFIRGLIKNRINEPCYFIFLKGDYDLIKDRMDKREPHYMKSGMLVSQFEALEEPDDAFTVDIHIPPDLICNAIYGKIIERLREPKEGGYSAVSSSGE